MKFLLYTHRKNIDWVSKKLEDVLEIMYMSNALNDLQFDVVEYSGKLEVQKGRITREWFESNLPVGKEYEAVIFHATETDGRKWKIKDGLRGSHYKDDDLVGEMWLTANKTSVVKFKDGTKRDRFTKVVLHEIAHHFKYVGRTDLDVHGYDYKNTINHIDGFYRDFKTDLLLTKKLTLLQQLLALLTRKERYTPLDKYWEYITQLYGVKNSTYKLIGRHIGVDIGCPLKTKIRARTHGEVTQVGYSDQLGYYCHFKFTLDGQEYEERYLHQYKMPKTGKFKAGSVIGYTGDTGFSTNPHLHVDTWVDKVQLERINKFNWDLLTVDPHSI